MADPQSSWPEKRTRPLSKRFWKPAAWLIALLLVVHTLSSASLREIGETLGNLGLLQITVLILVNIGIIFAFGLRWWWLLRSTGNRVPYLAILRYRLASFGVSYFTPGPQFGGEPLQVYYLRKNHAIPLPVTLASLSLDKLLELLANFTFLAVGLIIVLQGGHSDLRNNNSLPVIVVLLALLPWIYLTLLFLDFRVFTRLSKIFSPKAGVNAKLQAALQTICESENEMANYCQKHPLSLIGLMIVSALVWAALVLEYWIALAFLGAHLNLETTLVFIVAARLAFLTPLPGGLGALEYSQLFAAQTLGLEAALGASIGMIIRARDIIFGIIGLLWGGILTRSF